MSKIFSKNKIHFFNEIDSTNKIATQYIENKKAQEGDLFWTNYQSNGKGQKGNIWESELGKNLIFSFILKPITLEPGSQFMLNKVISLGLHDFFNSFELKKDFFIKWPNDIYYCNYKIAGILIENHIIGNKIEFSIIGIGINVNQVYFSEKIKNPISLKQIYSKEFELEELFKNVLKFLEIRITNLYNNDIDNINTDYLNNLLNYNTFSKYIYRNQILNAKIIGINKYGNLKLIDNEGIIYFSDLKELVFL